MALSKPPFIARVLFNTSQGVVHLLSSLPYLKVKKLVSISQPFAADVFDAIKTNNV